MLFDAPWFPLVVRRLRGSRRRGIGLIALKQDCIIAMQQSYQHLQIQFALALCFGSLNFRFHLQKQVFHLFSPGLFHLLFNEGQVA